METAKRSVREQIGPFELRSLLGRGGGGEAWAGVHLPTGTEIVLKRPTRGDLAAAERLNREILLSLRLQHPHVVRVLDARRAQEGVLPYLVLARAQRGTLTRYSLVEHPEALAQALLDTLAGLLHLHARGLLHLDIKPSNLFVSESPRGVRVQVGDLGSAIPRWAAGAPEVRHLAGTVGYMAPEHRTGERASLGPWTDLWSLGATARILAGEQPPAWLPPWIERCTATLPGDRFRSAAHAAQALRNAFAGASREALALATPVVPQGIFSFLGSAKLSPTSTEPFHEPIQEAPPPEAPTAEENAAPPDVNLEPSYEEDIEESELPQGLGAGAVGVRRPPLVGRTEQRRLLTAAWDRACADRGDLLVLEGPSGAGTTRLAEWFADYTQTQRGSAVFDVRLGSDGSGLLGALRRWTLGAGRQPGQSAQDHVKLRFAAEGLRAEEEFLRALASLLEGQPVSGARQAALLESLLESLRRHRPVVLLVDALDEHRGALTWLEGVIAQLHHPPSGKGNPCQVIVTQARPGRGGAGVNGLRLERGIKVETIQVLPLTRFATERLATRLLGFADHTSQQVAARSAGLPGHLVEYVASWVRTGALVQGERGLMLAPGAAPPLPSVLANRVRRRLETTLGRLSQPQRRTLAVVALLNGDDGRGTLQEALRRLELPAPPLEALKLAGLAVTAGTGWSWPLPGAGDALLEDDEQAARVFLACAQAMDPGGKLDGARCVRIAYFLERAGQPEAALETLARVLSVDLSPDVARSLLEILGQLRPPEAPVTGTLVAGLRARLHFERGDHAAAKEALPQALAPITPTTERERWCAVARLHALHTQALMLASEGHAHADANDAAKDALSWAERLGPDDVLVARLLIARVHVMTGRAAEILPRLEAWLQDAEQACAATRWRGLLLLTEAYSHAGQIERAVPPCRRAIAAMQAAGGHWLLGHAYNTLADALMRQRRFEEAIVTLHLALAELYPRTPTAGYVRANLAFCHLIQGQPEQAAHWINDAFAHLPLDSRHRLWCQLQSLRLPLLVQTDRNALDACCDDLEAWLAQQRIAHTEPPEAATMAAEALRIDDPERARRLFRLAGLLARDVEDPTVLVALRARWPAPLGEGSRNE